MTRIAYLNGDWVPLSDAKVSVLDRGFTFADGIYEYTAVLDGRLVDHLAHLERLRRSLDEIELSCPVPVQDLPALQLDLVKRNGLEEGGVYVQVTRGPAERDFAFPPEPRPTFLMFTQSFAYLDTPLIRNGIGVVTVPDIRWARRDIKSIALLGQVLAKQAAVKAGADDAWMVEDGHVTEGASSTAWIVTSEGRLVTRPLSNAILHGVTRKALLALCAETGLAVEERLFTVQEAHEAAEAFITGATTFVTPVVRIDDRVLSNGAPGPVTRRLREIYVETARATSYGG